METITINPLSIKYKPSIPICYGWNRKRETMSQVIEEMNVSESDRNLIREALVSLFVNDNAFKEALDTCKNIESSTKFLDLDSINQDVAKMYIEELQNLHRDAEVTRNATPEEFLHLYSQACEEDEELDTFIRSMNGGYSVPRLVKLGIFNRNYKGIVKLFRDLYRYNIICPYNPSGKPTFLTPATFVGWGGSNSMGQSFSFLPETFEDGYVVIECDRWGEFYKPEIREDRGSGVRLVRTENRYVILKLDPTKIQPSISLDGQMVSVSDCGKYVASISERGEFTVNIFYMSDDSSLRILLYTYDFCCK